MKKVMKTFTSGSKGFMRILLLCMIACFSLTQARADYYYKVKLAYMNGEPYTINGKEWSDWIFVSKGSDLKNALSKLVGETHSEQVTDNNGNQKPKYSATLGVTIHDVSNNEITLGYTDAGTTVENEDNCYKNRTHTFKIVGMAIGRGTDNGGDILQYSDHAAFGRMKDDLIELDLAAWNKEKFTGSYYMSNMSKLEKLILPDHNFAIGDNYMFAGAHNLTEIKYGHYDADYKTLTKTDNCNVTCIGKGAFENCNNLPNEHIREMINSVATYITNNNPTKESGLEYNKIGDNAFYHCYQLTGEFTIPASIKYIGMQAFEKCNITKLTCTSELKEIGDRAFKQNYKLNTVDLNNINKIGVEAFDMKNTDNQKSALTTVSLGGANIRIDSKAFRSCGWLTNFGLKGEARIKQLNDGVFLDCRTFTSASVKTILDNYAEYSDQLKEGEKYIPANLFFGVNGHYDYGTDAEKNEVHDNFTELTIPSQFAYIGKGAFGVSEKDYNYISSITVSRGNAPDCRSIDGTNSVVSGRGTFENVKPNYVTITFNGDAAGYSTNGSTGYMTYRKEPEFMRLLTKTLNEDDETYDVYPQMYADVKLTRSFKQGWNTLALPFGSPSYPNGRDMDCAEVYTKALDATDIAVYRGLRVNSQDASKSVFTFLHYGNVQVDPLDEFEPILVKMPAAEKKEYTFTNVDLNYDKDNNKLYTAAEILERGCKNSTGGHFDGKYNDGDPVNFPLFNGNNYTTFYFDGTFKMIKDESNSIFKEGDYIIQDGKFIMCKTGKKYGMKAFRGYFKKFDSAPLGASEAINIAVCDGDGTVTDIVRVDANGEAEANAPHDIYNIMGQKVRSNALSTEGLKSGIYIINGKKVLVK